MRFLNPVLARLLFFAAAMIALSAFADDATPAVSPREHLSLDANWKFHLGDDWPNALHLDKAGASTGPASEQFGDVSWRTINLPHDWAIELPFDKNADGSHGFKALGPGFPKNSIGWYRYGFELPKEDESKRIWLTFDGVFRDATVWINGWLVKRHEGGYYPFREDITDVVHFGGRNTIAVRVEATKFEGWFYEGAGIYRHVWLDKTAPVAIAPDGVFVYSKFKDNVPEGPLELHVQTRLKNALTNDISVVVTQIIYGPPGVIAGGNILTKFEKKVTVPLLGEIEITNVLKPIKRYELWSPESPKLYRLATIVSPSRGPVTLTEHGHYDEVETAFGIRTVGFDPTNGFLLNGKHYELYGTCNHQDMAGVGAALPDALQEFRVKKLKEFGCNAIRTSHNPPTPELLDACDRLGILIMDESRLLGSDSENLRKWDGQIRRDRNHPSVAIWSVANEEFSVQDSPQGANVARTMQDYVKRLDPTRPVTYAAPEGDSFWGINGVIEVRGWNYHVGQDMDDYHAKHPNQPEVGTEQGSTVSTRGIYENDPVRGYVSAYDTNAPSWAHTAERWWSYFADRPWLSGGFVWTGFDYRGEPTPYSWPCINSHFGILDTCGFPKDNFYYYQSWWTTNIVLHLLPHWNWPGQEGREIRVDALSNCKQVELFLNGAPLGKQAMKPNSKLSWQVKYAPGVLSAKGFDENGNQIAETKVETTGEPVAIQLTRDPASVSWTAAANEARRRSSSDATAPSLMRSAGAVQNLAADGEDVAVFTVSALDAQGRAVPTAQDKINFAIEGPGKILGVGNGDPSCHEPDVFIPIQSSRTVQVADWRWQPAQVPDNGNSVPEYANDFDDSSWNTIKARPDSATGELVIKKENTTAIFRAHVTLTGEDLKNPGVLIHFNGCDDEGWYLVNNQLVGESHDWQAQPTFSIKNFLHEGDNVIAVGVKNNGGEGGLNPNVSVELVGQPVVSPWSRSLFNGLAQIIVQSTRDAGEIKLTASANGLRTATATIETVNSPSGPRVP